MDQWFADIRDRIGRHLQLQHGGVVLAASGTDVELLALGLTLALSKQPVTNILIAPEETGSGIPRAAAGRHFAEATALGYRAAAGEMLDGICRPRRGADSGDPQRRQDERQRRTTSIATSLRWRKMR